MSCQLQSIFILLSNCLYQNLHPWKTLVNPISEQKGKATAKSSSPLICTNAVKAVDTFGLERKTKVCESHTSSISNESISDDSITSGSSPNGELMVN